TDPSERLERRAIVAADVVEIGPRLVGQQHGLGVQRVDHPRGDAHLQLRKVRFVHHRLTCHRWARLKTPESGARAPVAPRSSRRGTHQAMMSGILLLVIIWIWSLSRSLRRLRRTSSSWSEQGSAASAAISSSRRRCSAFKLSKAPCPSGPGSSSFIASDCTAKHRPPERPPDDDLNRRSGEPFEGSRQSRRFVVYCGVVTCRKEWHPWTRHRSRLSSRSTRRFTR